MEHLTNIVIHVMAGTIALIAGLIAMFVKKGGKIHIASGRYFMWAMIIVIITGLFGVLVFKRNTFLLVITLLAGYNCFSGIRVFKQRRSIDYIVPLVVMASVCFIRSMYWSAVIIYSTIGALLLVTTWDLLKWSMPALFLKRAVMYEHVYKMVSALSALASAFIGTTLPQYKPYSQFLPSMVGLTSIIVIFIMMSNKRIQLHQAN
jgi:hypothetical protein